MAKKKTAETANIKAAPVLRAVDPVPVKTKSYAMRDDWKDMNIVNYVAFKSVDGEVRDLTVNGEPAGGGGGFAPVSFYVNNNSQEDVVIEGVFVNDNIIEPEWYFAAGDDNEYQVVAPSLGYIDTIAQQIQIGTVTATGNITVTTLQTGVYRLAINGAGHIFIS